MVRATRPLTLASFLFVCACGKRGHVRSHEPPSLVAPALSATPAASSSAAPPPPPPPAPAPASKAPRAKFVSFAFAATSGKVDKIGSKDGAFSPDGVKDLVFDAEVEGASVIAFMIVATDGSFTADTFVGTQLPPSDADAEIKPGLGTAGIGVYENDKLVNAPDGSLMPLAAGKHELELYVSSREVPKKASFKAFAVLHDRSMVASPIVSTTR